MAHKGSKKSKDIVRELRVRFRAGDCLYFKTKNPQTKTSWEEQGIKGFARANKYFFPDLSQLAKNPTSVHSIALSLKDMDMAQKRILMWAIYNSNKIEQETEKLINIARQNGKKPLFTRPLKFGQPVYVNLSAPYVDYVNCWFECYILAMGTEDEEGIRYIYLTGNLDNVEGSLISVPIESIMTKPKFIKHRELLIDQGKLYADAVDKDYVIAHEGIDFEDIPTIESIKDMLDDFDDEEYEDEENDDLLELEDIQEVKIIRKRKKATIDIL